MKELTAFSHLFIIDTPPRYASYIHLQDRLQDSNGNYNWKVKVIYLFIYTLFKVDLHITLQ